MRKETYRIGVFVAVFFIIVLFILNIPKNIYIVNVRTGYYHRMGCKYAQRINPRNMKWERDMAKIEKQGFVPCSNCFPGKENGKGSRE